MAQIKPVEIFRNGTVKASIFEREVKGPKGAFTSQSVALQISYTDKQGNWKNNTITVVKKNIPKVLDVLSKAGDYCA